jgi:type I restriction enzyme S subunit
MVNNWKIYTVEEFADVVGGGTPSTRDEANFGGDIPWITPKDLSNYNFRYICRGERNITEKGLKNSNATLLPQGTILLSSRAPVGYLAIAANPVTTNQGFKSLIVRNGFNNEFVYYLLKANIDYLKSQASGTTFGELSGGTLKKLSFWLPPLPEQHAIAEVLGALDDKIELNRRMNATLEAMAQALFRHWFVDNPEKEGWEVKTIGEVVTLVGGSTPSTANPDFWKDGNINWATPKDLANLQSPVLLDTNSRITELGLQQISSGLLPTGTILLSSRAPIGYLAITQIPVAINQGFIAIKCTEEAPSYFILNWLKDNMEKIIGRANGTTFLEISKSNFRPMKIIIPPSEKMKVFVETVEPLYKKIVANLKESRTLAELRDTLLPKLMRGEVRVRTADGR